jgi:hypothetical protein
MKVAVAVFKSPSFLLIILELQLKLLLIDSTFATVLSTFLRPKYVSTLFMQLHTSLVEDLLFLLLMDVDTLVTPSRAT